MHVCACSCVRKGWDLCKSTDRCAFVWMCEVDACGCVGAGLLVCMCACIRGCMWKGEWADFDVGVDQSGWLGLCMRACVCMYEWVGARSYK